MDEEGKEARSSAGKSQWGEMSDVQREFFRQSGYDAVRRAIKNGSKLEVFIMESLKKLGYLVEFHRDGLLSDENLQIDLFLPAIKLAIEIDGPSHYLPIWGEENLHNNILSDNKKNDLLIKNGYVVLRIKNTAKSLSQVNQRIIMEKMLDHIHSIENKFPDIDHRLIFLELS